MRTISADAAGVLSAVGGRRNAIRVSVRDSAAVYRDLTTYPTLDFVEAVTWRDSVDSPGMTAEIDITREVEQLSAAPLMEDSPLNRTFNPGSSAIPLVEIGRQIKIETSLVPDGSAPVVWDLMFEGYIDTIDWAASPMRIECRGLEAKLMDTFIELERVYSHAQGANATKGLLIYEVSHLYALNELVIPSDAKRNGHYYRVTTAGSSSTEPTWPTGGGATVGSGTAVFTEVGVTSTTTGTAIETIIQQILNDNVPSAPTLSVPSSPGWMLKWFKQVRQSVWDGISALAAQQGLDLRYRWDSGTSTFKLTLSLPDRAKTVADRTFTEDERWEMSELRRDIAFIRNVVRVVYSDSGALDPQGNPLRTFVNRVDTTSLAAYGRRFMEVAESSTSNIDTIAEATAMADRMLSDLAEPGAEQNAQQDFFPFVELGDLYAFDAAGSEHYSSQQKLAVVGWEHSFTVEAASTSLTCRGKPASSYRRWLQTETTAEDDTHAMNLSTLAGLALTASAVVGGVKLQVTPGAGAVNKMRPPLSTEVHVSATSGFTPSAATLQASGQNDTVEISKLNPGQTYYAKVIPFGYNDSKIVRGLPSEQVSFVAGQAYTGHLQAEPDWGLRPLNGGFETQFGTEPDHWTRVSGTAGVRTTGATAYSGSAFLRVQPAASFLLQSKNFGMPGDGTRIGVSMRVRYNSGSAGSMTCELGMYNSAGTFIGNVTVGTINAASLGPIVAGAWYQFGTVLTSLGGIGSFTLSAPTTGNASFDVDEIRIIEIKPVESAGLEDNTNHSTASGSFATLLTLSGYRQSVPGHQLAVDFRSSLYSTALSTGVEYQVVATYADGTTETSNPFRFMINQASVHQSVSRVFMLYSPPRLSGSGALSVSFALQWRVYSGAGTLTMNADDYTSIRVKEM